MDPGLWVDGRSGPIGCAAGERVLEQLSKKHGRFSHRKGTVFETEDALWVGRFAHEAYLRPPTRHWANVGGKQHRVVKSEATEMGKSLFYLFITAAPSQAKPVLYWAVPADVVEAMLSARGNRLTAIGVHIFDRNGRYFLGDDDVTQYYEALPVDAELRQLFLDVAAPKRLRTERPDDRDWPDTTPSPELGAGASGVNVSAMRRRNYPVPLSGGRSAVLSLPVPLHGRDVNRIKGWVDLMADVLTQEETESPVPVQRDRRNPVRELRERGVIGAWKDRDDIEDSSVFARKLREQAQTRRRD